MKAQQVTAKEMFVEAESYFLFEDYKDALPLYQKIYRIEPENYNVCYKIGICYLNDIYNKQKSIRYLEDAVNFINQNYKINSFKEKLAPPEALYYLGVAYRKSAMLNEAIETFNEFLDIADKDLFNVDLINEEIQSCKYALELKKDELLVEKHNRLGEINSNYAEFNPVISGNGKVMAFVRKLPFYEAVFLSTLDDKNEWGPGINLTEYFGLDGNSYCTGLSYDGDEIYVYRSDNFDGNIYVSYYKKDQWTMLEKLGDNINTKYWESHASLSPDGKYLYFTSNRKGGYGGLDIYKSERLKDGDWGKAVNLGNIINSSYNEDTPFLTRNGKKLYFSSMGHKSSGGYDIFISEKDKEGNWSKPVNLGYPFNTPDDELFYCPATDDEWGYFAMFDPQLTKGLTDIFYVSVFRDRDLRNADSLSYEKSAMKLKFSLRGKVKSFFGSIIDYSKVKIFLADDDGNVIDSASVNPDGSYGFIVNAGKYNLVLKGEGIEDTSVSVTVDSLQTYSNENVVDFNINVKSSNVALQDSIDKASVFSIEKKQIVVSDSKKVNIPLTCLKGSAFKIEAFTGDSLIGKLTYTARKDNPIFVYKPVPGENTVVFKLVEGDSVIKEEIVIIQNYTNLDVPITEKEVQDEYISVAQVLNDLIQLSDGNIKSFLQEGEFNDDISLQELLDQLYAATASHNFDSAQVDLLLGLYLTQKETTEFFQQVAFADTSLSKYSNKADSVDIPLALLLQMRADRRDYSFDNDFVRALEQNFDSLLQAHEYINSFRKYSGSTISITKLGETGVGENEQTGSASATTYKPIDLAITTQEINSFYQNLIFCADDSLRIKLAAINFKTEELNNSLDLVFYLLNNSSEFGYSKGQIIEFIDKTKLSRSSNIEQFIEMLSENAVGQIKTHLLELKDNANDFDSYDEVIYHLSSNSQTAGYSRKELYTFLLDLSGVVSAEDAINYLKEKANDEIIASLEDMPLEQVSNAFEVFQYLLANTSKYAFTEWDICQILSQMLLEKGDSHLPEDPYADSVRTSVLSENTTKIIVLFGLALSIILILFFVMRNKRQKKED